MLLRALIVCYWNIRFCEKKVSSALINHKDNFAMQLRNGKADIFKFRFIRVYMEVLRRSGRLFCKFKKRIDGRTEIVC